MEEHKQFNLQTFPQNSLPQSDFLSAPSFTRTDKTLNVKDFHILNNSEFVTLRGQKFGRTAINTLVTGSVYSVAATDYLLGITSLSYAPSIGLPRPDLVGVGKTFKVKDEVGGAATTTITIRSEGEKNIDGSATKTITTNYGVVTLYNDGANWFTC